MERSTWRVLRALLELEETYLKWPDAVARRRISETIGRAGPFHSCVGFVDGSIIPFAVKPATEDFADFWTRRKRVYGWNIALVCDYGRHVLGVHTGWTAAAHDQRVFNSTGLYLHPERFFSPNEYLLADSGYEASQHVVPAYKRLRNQPRLPPEEEAFNYALSRVRVRVEHTFGLMKERFKSLEGMRILLRTDVDQSRSRLWVICVAILHNFLLTNDDDDYWEGQDMGALQAQWEHAAEQSRLDRERWEQSNLAENFVTADGDQRTREYVRQFAEAVGYGPAFSGGTIDVENI